MIHVYAKRQTWICTTWPSFPLNCRLLFITSTQKISSFTPVLSIRIVQDSFYPLIFYSEKFSTWIWRLPFAVNVSLISLLIAVSHFKIALRTGSELGWIKLWDCFGELTNENKQPINEELASGKQSHNAIPHNSCPVSCAASNWQITLLKRRRLKWTWKKKSSFMEDKDLYKVYKLTQIFFPVLDMINLYTSCLCNFLFLFCVVKKYIKTKRPTWGSNPRPWD